MTLNILKNIKTKIFFVVLISQFILADELVVIDVRSLEEVKTGVIQDAIHIEWTKIEEEITNLDISKDQPIFDFFPHHLLA